LNPIMISIGTSCGTNADSSLVILYQVWNNSLILQHTICKELLFNILACKVSFEKLVGNFSYV
jgi:hypothetical protein